MLVVSTDTDAVPLRLCLIARTKKSTDVAHPVVGGIIRRAAGDLGTLPGARPELGAADRDPHPGAHAVARQQEAVLHVVGIEGERGAAARGALPAWAVAIDVAVLGHVAHRIRAAILLQLCD